MNRFTTEGVIVNALPFRNYDCILTVFTPQEGLVKLFFRGAYSQKRSNGSGTTTPLSVVDIVYAKGKGELLSCVEISVKQHNLALRQNFPMLEAAGEMLQAVTMTQQPGKAAPELYQLLLMYLNKLPQTASPQAIARSFQLKLMRYEGSFSLLSHCSECSEVLNDTWIHAGEAYCRSHTPSEALSLTKDERGLVEHLAFCRDFAALAEIKISGPLSYKINQLFAESL